MDGERAKAVESIGSSSTAHPRHLLSKSSFLTGDELNPPARNPTPPRRHSTAPNDSIDLRPWLLSLNGGSRGRKYANWLHRLLRTLVFQCVGIGVFALLVT